jgi:hypothetical protein
MTIRGKLSYARILGDPVLNYSKDGKEWKLDLEIPESAVKEFKTAGLTDRVKTKDGYLDGKPHVTFKISEFRKDPDPETGLPKRNRPPKIVDILGEAWDQDKLLGNGTDADVSFVVQDHGPGKKKGMYLRSVRVLKLVPYEGKDDAPPIDESDPFYAEAAAARARKEMEAEQFKKDFGLDDSVEDLDDPVE